MMRTLKPKGTYLTMEQIGMIKVKLLQSNLSARKLSPLMPIGNATLNYKLNGRQEFTQTEIYKICKLLNITLSEIHAYFFDTKLSDATKSTKVS